MDQFSVVVADLLVQVDVGLVPASVDSSGLAFQLVSVVEVDISHRLGEVLAAPFQVSVVVANMMVQVDLGIFVPAAINSSGVGVKVTTLDVCVLRAQRERHFGSEMLVSFFGFGFFFFL